MRTNSLAVVRNVKHAAPVPDVHSLHDYRRCVIPCVQLEQPERAAHRFSEGPLDRVYCPQGGQEQRIENIILSVYDGWHHCVVQHYVQLYVRCLRLCTVKDILGGDR